LQLAFIYDEFAQGSIPVDGSLVGIADFKKTLLGIERHPKVSDYEKGRIKTWFEENLNAVSA
jgi:hypothetical protein